MNSEFAKRFKQLRIEKKVTLRQLAVAIGVSDSAVSQWELGKTSILLEHAILVADYFNVSIDYLAGRTEY